MDASGANGLPFSMPSIDANPIGSRPVCSNGWALWPSLGPEKCALVALTLHLDWDH